ncbi:MAG: RimK/LysX family protein [Bacteroidia bacterium]|nr:RimK/LysX family protein [Bacteroidia bacterium]
MFGKLFYAYFSLSNRSTMEYPVLIGKNILRNRFLVDVSQEYCSNQFKP